MTQPVPIPFPGQPVAPTAPMTQPTPMQSNSFVSPVQAPPPVQSAPQYQAPAPVSSSYVAPPPAFDPNDPGLLISDVRVAPGSWLCRFVRMDQFKAKVGNDSYLKPKFDIVGEISRVPQESLPAHYRGMAFAVVGSQSSTIMSLQPKFPEHLKRDLIQWVAALNGCHQQQLSAAHMDPVNYMGDVYSGRYFILQAEFRWSKAEQQMIDVLQGTGKELPASCKGSIISKPYPADLATIQRFVPNYQPPTTG